MAQILDAPLIAARVSRLLVDANRAPDAHDLIPTHAEDVLVPGNVVTPGERARRIEAFHEPFHAAIETLLEARPDLAAIVSIHSFTPFLFGKQRPWHAGLLHDEDAGISDVMIAELSRDPALVIGRNQPYGPTDGVFYTMARHARARASAMIEIRNDLLEDEAGVARWADRLARALTVALNAPGLGDFDVQRKASNRS
jgi:predicted N-formylglutamate amidohydrolase